MNEVRAIVEAFDAALARGEQSALATVVSVEGSSYRRPGARMLISQTGSTVGIISAGCLESDVVEHAKTVMRTGRRKLVEYDTSSASDEEAWGLGLGCNGIVRIFVEPVEAGSLYIEALRRSGEEAVSVATVYQSNIEDEIGGRLIIDEKGNVRHERLSSDLARKIETELALIGVTPSDDPKVFFEVLQPPAHLLIFGTGPDALPVVELARQLGWQTEVIDPQSRPATLSRFDSADKVTLMLRDDAQARLHITSHTMVLVMSHNYAQDLAFLRLALDSPARYIGVVGSRERTGRMLSELGESASLDRLHAPAGLDIGANSPTEIAVSIIAEICAVTADLSGGSLRDRPGSIHPRLEIPAPHGIAM